MFTPSIELPRLLSDGVDVGVEACRRYAEQHPEKAIRILASKRAHLTEALIDATDSSARILIADMLAENLRQNRIAMAAIKQPASSISI